MDIRLESTKMSDLSNVPLVALSTPTRDVISTLLNPRRVIPSKNGLPRDWRGLAHLSGLSGEIMPLLSSHSNPSDHILSVLMQKMNYTLEDLRGILEKIERWDIIDDTIEFLEKDAETYMRNLEKSQVSAEMIEKEIDEQVLTTDDLHRLNNGLDKQHYDAFLLYADEDTHFATEMLENLETKYNLKICVKDRDLIVGVTFEHEAVMTLISERCNRLIVIVTKNFLKSPANKFFLNYAQALGIDKRQRKIIPCSYEKCQLPPQLSYMFTLDYNRKGLYDFWGKLSDSVRVATSVPDRQASIKSNKEDMDLLLHKSIIDTRNESSENVEDINKPDGSFPKILGKISISQNIKQVTNTENTGNKRLNNFLQWTRQKCTWKVGEKDEDLPATETITIENMPSLSDLSPLNTTSILEQEKPIKKSLVKSLKKVKLKKIRLKS